MKLTALCELELRYTWTDFVDYGAGGQYLGSLEGVANGDRLNGTLMLVNVPTKRPDNVNCPAIRGILTTADGAKLYLEMNGLALRRAADEARVFTTSLSYGPATHGTPGSTPSSALSRASSTPARRRPPPERSPA